MSRTLENCNLIKKMGAEPAQHNGKCYGFARSEWDDEPCETCKVCKLNYYYDDGKEDNT